MAESKIIFYEGTQEEYDSSSKDENGIYFITDSKAIYKGSVKYSGESEIATPASPGAIKPGESFEVSSDGKPSPSPKYPREITNVKSADIAIAGKNLIEKAVVDSYTARFAIVLKLKMKLSPSTQYCLSFEDAKDNRYYLNETVFEYQQITATGSRQFLLVKTKDVLDKSNSLQFDSINGCWVILKNDKEQSNAPQFKNVQFELGSDNTPYEAPSKPIALPINLQGNELCSLPNGVRDEVRIDGDGNVELVKRTWKLQKRIGDMNNDEKYPGWRIPRTEMTPPISDGEDIFILNARNSHFSLFHISTQASYGDKWLLYTYGEGYVQSELIAQYPDEVVTFIGELATPIITSLGKIDMPTLPAPVCNAWANDENPTDVKFSYIRDVNIAYEKLASALANAMNIPTTIPELEL